MPDVETAILFLGKHALVVKQIREESTGQTLPPQLGPRHPVEFI